MGKLMIEKEDGGIRFIVQDLTEDEQLGLLEMFKYKLLKKVEFRADNVSTN